MTAALKGILKSVRGMIDSHHYSDAIALIKSELEKGTTDYTLYLLAGYVSYVQRDLRDAVLYYRCAIELDKEQLKAWQGIFNVYNDPDWSDFNDDLALVVINHLLKNSPNPDKISAYESAKVKFLVRSLKFDLMLEQWDFISDRIDTDSSIDLLQKLDVQKNETERKLASLLLDRIQMSDCVDEVKHAAVCKCVETIRPPQENYRWAIDHLRKFSKQCKHERIVSFVLKKMQTNLISFQPIDEELLRLCETLPTLPISSQAEFCQHALAQLLKKDYNGIYESLLNVNLEELSTESFAFAITLYVYRQLGQFYKISAVLENSWKQCRKFKQDILFLKLEADFMVSECISDYKALLREFGELEELRNVPASSFPISIKCALITSRILSNEIITETELKRTVDSLFNASFTSDNDLILFTSHFFNAVFYYHKSEAAVDNRANLLDLARNELRNASQLVGVSSTLPLVICNTTALGAQILISRGQTQLAMSQLVNAAQKQAYAAENFRLLAQCLFTSGVMEKAKLCAERAHLLNPKSEHTAILLHKIYTKLGLNETEKISKLISDLLEWRPNSKWALRQSAFFELNASCFEAAIEKLQRLIRINTAISMSDSERKEMCTLWIYLSEAYRQCGNLQSAVRASKSIIQLFPGHLSALLQLIQLYQSMGNYVSALEVGDELLEQLDNVISPDLKYYIKLLYAHSLILHITNDHQLVDEQREPLARLFPMLRDLLTSNAADSSVLLQKILAQALDVLLSYNLKFFEDCVSDLQLSNDFWKISSRKDALNSKLQCLARILQKKPESANTWNDMANTFMLQFRLTREPCTLDRCIVCVRKALNLTASKFKISGFYCTLGLIHVLKNNARTAQHYFIRAIQLDRHNANPWCLLGLLYMKCNLFDEGFFAFSEAQKINPNLMAAWCGQAMHAEVNNDYDTMDLYRHAIFLQPTELAVKKYGYFLTQYIRKNRHHEEGTMLDFRMIKDLTYRSELDDDFLHMLALLAEQFGYYEDAKKIINDVTNVDLLGVCRNSMRIRIRNMDIDALKEDGDKTLNALRTLYAMSNAELFKVLKEHPTMKKLFAAIEQQNVNEFSSVYLAEFFPLITAASIIFGLCKMTPDLTPVLFFQTISQELFGIVENIRPLHRLVDVYPLTGICRSEFFTFQQQNEEEKILVRRDHLSEELYNILLSMSDEQTPTPV